MCSSTTGWLAVMTNDAAPPWATMAVVAEIVSSGTTIDLMVTETVFGVPDPVGRTGGEGDRQARSDSTTLSVTVGMATWSDVWPAGTTTLPPGNV